MCGIAGIFSYHYAANPVDRSELQRVRDHMARRGPDGFGEWFSDDGRVGFGHRRLSIIDLSDRGAQPMLSADGCLAITFNGEIYNYLELRRALEMKGARFRTQTDTEVLLQLYAFKGADMVNDLRGMFAFAIWDAHKGGILLARDPYGIKPLYYADDGWTVRFASQVKALMAGGKISREPEPAGWAGFYLFGSVPEPFTTFQDVRALAAGCTAWIDRVGTHEPKRYFSLASAYREGEQSAFSGDQTEQVALVKKALADSVRYHLVADVPVGAFLSSGIDSGALVGLMRDAGQREIQTITLAFEEFRGTKEDEAPLAGELAKLYGTKHSTRYVGEQEFHDDLPKIIEAMDQPTIDGLNSWFVSKAAHELGLKVAISGLGGDELFGGYPSFRDVPRFVRTFTVPGLVPGVGRMSRWALSSLGEFVPSISPKAAGLLEYGSSYAGAYLLRRGLFMPWELESLLGRDLAFEGLRRLAPIPLIDATLEEGPRRAHSKVAVLESALYMRNQLLRDTDWASMAHSLEVRVPLVDVHLLSQVAQVVGSRRAVAISKSLLGLAPRTGLPENVLHRPKTGFQTPIQSWLQGDKRIQKWREIPTLARKHCVWARRWAFQVDQTRLAA